MGLFFIGVMAGWTLHVLLRSMFGPGFLTALKVYDQAREKGLPEAEARNLGLVYQAYCGVKEKGISLRDFRTTAMKLHIADEPETDE